MKTINILGDTQREQWHGVVNMLRQLGGDMDYRGRSQLCDELDRYIDAMEDANEQEEQETHRMSVAEQDAVILWSVWHKNGSLRAIKAVTGLWEQDRADFMRIVETPVEEADDAIESYGLLDTAARDKFIGIIKEIMA